ncbi:hypothetical protein SAMN04487991_0756 [Celeribacter neptunius]|uniref:Uncharacterized protein n=1 Tax=Celeribacter neptunius TaxID=588602 RepID=A0A1I3KQB2_9RHOB|nr:hypothetical protein SAMN04487991_0756 [Celeribacter neptunius]
MLPPPDRPAPGREKLLPNHCPDHHPVNLIKFQAVGRKIAVGRKLPSCAVQNPC